MGKTLGDRAKKIKGLKMRNLKLCIEKYRGSKEGTLGHSMIGWLLSLKEKDTMGLAIEEYLIGLEELRWRWKGEILSDLLEIEED